MHAVRRTSVLPLLLVAGLAVAGCGGGSSDDDGSADADAAKDLPKVKQNAIQDAPDVATANARCAAYQKAKPKRVTQMRFRVKGSPSVPCIIQ